MRPAIAALACLALVAGCGGSATEDNVADAVPGDVRAYAHADRGSDDWRDARDALRKLPAIESTIVGLLGTIPGEPEADEVGLAIPASGEDPLVLTREDPAIEPRGASLAQLPAYRELLDGLPDERFVHGYLGGDGIRPLRSLDRSLTAAAGAADVDGDRMHVRIRARHDGEPGRCTSRELDSELLEAVDPAAALYAELPSIRCALTFLARRFPGVGEALGRFARVARERGDVSLQKELLPLLDRRGAVIATPGEAGPVLTLVVDDVDEEEALDLFARLQPALIRLLGAGPGAHALSFGAAEVEGVTAATARLSPTLELSYAAWDRRLVVATSLEGIAAMRRGEGLPGNDAFDEVLGDRPDAVSALLFLDLDQVLVLGEQAGLAADPRYLAVRDDLQKLRAAGAVLSREDDFTTAELNFQIP